MVTRTPGRGEPLDVTVPLRVPLVPWANTVTGKRASKQTTAIRMERIGILRSNFQVKGLTTGSGTFYADVDGTG
jgi:hypothetical protein